MLIFNYVILFLLLFIFLDQMPLLFLFLLTSSLFNSILGLIIFCFSNALAFLTLIERTKQILSKIYFGFLRQNFSKYLFFPDSVHFTDSLFTTNAAPTFPGYLSLLFTTEHAGGCSLLLLLPSPRKAVPYEQASGIVLMGSCFSI